MSLLQLFGKRTKKKKPQEKAGAEKTKEGGPYSGMRVEVTSDEGKLLFVAKLMALRADKAELHQYSQVDFSSEEALHVQIRGYNDHDRKAVYMEGVITPKPQRIWEVAGLTVSRVGNARAFFRLSTDLEAAAIVLSGSGMGEKPCRLLNISVGGACIRAEHRFHEGDKFLLKVKLIEDRPESVMFCQVLRVIEKDSAPLEYGCQFLELAEDAQEEIIQNIFEVQRQKMGRS